MAVGRSAVFQNGLRKTNDARIRQRDELCPLASPSPFRPAGSGDAKITMSFDTIADIFSANRSVRDRLASVLSSVKPDEAMARPEGEGWSIQQIVEHLTMVEFGTARICTKLLNEAKKQGKLSKGRVELSAVFAERTAQVATQRLEAPDRVHPTGNV